MLFKKTMEEKIIKQKDAWDNLSFNWGKYVTPPARPCLGLLKNWEKIVKGIAKETKNPKALILGATPELRDLVLKYNFESFACDINPNMLEAMDRLMKYKKHPKNKKIIANWLKINFPKRNFDLILGHLALEQILCQKDLKKLLNKLKNLLKPNGLFLVCSLKHNKEPFIKGNDWEKVFSEYEKNKISDVEVYFFLKYNSDWNSYKKSPSILDTPSIYKRIKKLSSKDRTILKFYKWWGSVLGVNSKPVLVFAEKDFKKLFSQYFWQKKMSQCRDHQYCNFMESYLGKPKK